MYCLQHVRPYCIGYIQAGDDGERLYILYNHVIQMHVNVLKTIYRHVFYCSTAQCSLAQSGYGMATIYTQAIVSVNRLKSLKSRFDTIA